jgi:hypothetical protein
MLTHERGRLALAAPKLSYSKFKQSPLRGCSCEGERGCKGCVSFFFAAGQEHVPSSISFERPIQKRDDITQRFIEPRMEEPERVRCIGYRVYL